MLSVQVAKIRIHIEERRRYMGRVIVSIFGCAPGRSLPDLLFIDYLCARKEKR